MVKIPGIAWREFKHTALTKAFIIGSIIAGLIVTVSFSRRSKSKISRTELQPFWGAQRVKSSGMLQLKAVDWRPQSFPVWPVFLNSFVILSLFSQFPKDLPLLSICHL